MVVCIKNPKGKTLLHQEIPSKMEPLLEILKPYLSIPKIKSASKFWDISSNNIFIMNFVSPLIAVEVQLDNEDYLLFKMDLIFETSLTIKT
jgi:hypothetical protein